MAQSLLPWAMFVGWIGYFTRKPTDRRELARSGRGRGASIFTQIDPGLRETFSRQSGRRGRVPVVRCRSHGDGRSPDRNRGLPDLSGRGSRPLRGSRSVRHEPIVEGKCVMPICYPHVVLAAAIVPAFGACAAQRPDNQTTDAVFIPKIASVAVNELPAPIRCFVDHSNRGDSAAVVGCFTADAVLDDWGRRFKGHAGIAAWDRSDNTGVRAHLEVSSVVQVDGTYDVAVTVSGGGYNGSGHMHFLLRDGRIARLKIA